MEGKKLQLHVTKAFSENTRTVAYRLILEWIAAHYWRHFGLCLEHEQQILTVFFMNVKRFDSIDRSSIPQEFDAHKQWPYCPTLREVFEQGKCASCWVINNLSSI
jgi:hypothetical protein